MAEALAIIGLVSNIISFIDYGIKLVSGSRLARDSLHGTTTEIHELELIVEDVQRLNAEVLRQKSSRELSKDELHILDMVTECDRLANELRGVVNKLKMRDGVLSKTLESGRVAMRGLWKKREIEDLRRRLTDLDYRIRNSVRDALQGLVIAFLRNIMVMLSLLNIRDGERIKIRSGSYSTSSLKVPNRKHSAILSDLKAIEESHQQLEINYESKLSLIQEEILNLPEQCRNDVITQVAQLRSLKTKLDILDRERITCERQSKIIKSLHFPELRRRWSQIPEADHRTNAWLFDRSLTSFTDWLESEDGIYWINGRVCYHILAVRCPN